LPACWPSGMRSRMLAQVARPMSFFAPDVNKDRNTQCH
jgi:hypothetical protein